MLFKMYANTVCVLEIRFFLAYDTSNFLAGEIKKKLENSERFHQTIK